MIWAAAWLYKATKKPDYRNYIVGNINNLKMTNDLSYSGGSFAEFGWDAKHAGINVLVSNVSICAYYKAFSFQYVEFGCKVQMFSCFCLQLLLLNSTKPGPFILSADKFVCAMLPESPSLSVSYSPGNCSYDQLLSGISTH